MDSSQDPLTSSKVRSSGSGAKVPLAAGAGLLGVLGLARKSPAILGGAALAAAGALAARRRADSGWSRPRTATATFAINCSQLDAYKLWRQFERMPEFMPRFDSVTLLEDGTVEWTLIDSMGVRIRWIVEITEEVEGRRIAWRSTPQSSIESTGAIEFRPGPRGRGIIATLSMEYVAPGGTAGKLLLSAVGRSPEFTVREGLRRFKALLETGEVPTTVGQPHGPRGVLARVEQTLLREKPAVSHPTAGKPAARIA